MSSTKRIQKHKKRSKTQKIQSYKSINGENKPLYKFWRELATGKKVVLIYKNKTHKIVSLKKGTENLKKQYASFDDDTNIVSILTSPISEDAYQVHLYPKAKNTSVKNVIDNYKKYFKTEGKVPKDLVAQGWRWDKLAYPY